jgi:hypothetical protein
MNDVATVVAAALAGVPAGVQSLGPWAGRRQLFVRFAGEAETASRRRSRANSTGSSSARHSTRS